MSTPSTRNTRGVSRVVIRPFLPPIERDREAHNMAWHCFVIEGGAFDLFIYFAFGGSGVFLHKNLPYHVVVVATTSTKVI